MHRHFWQDKYPAGVPAQIDPDNYDSIQDVLEQACRQFADKPAFTNLGYSLTYAQLERDSAAFAAWLQQHTDLQPGDRIAIQLPNLLQYPVAVFGAIRAGLVVVNTNPLYTAREMQHQFVDSGAKAIVCLVNMADKLEQVLSCTAIETVILTQVADSLPPPKRWLINAAVKYVKRMVPSFKLAQAHSFVQVLHQGRKLQLQPVSVQPTDLAALQYTGGTTGVAKGAMLSHRNLIANMLQARTMIASNLEPGQETVVTPLPLYHIYAFTFHCMAMMLIGCNNLLITNPRDMPGMLKDMRRNRFSAFVGLNTLFAGLCAQPEFAKLDFSALKLTVSGGMALQLATANQWEQITGVRICEGYGLTETSPVISVNPVENNQLGTIGIPVPSTLCKVVDESGVELPLGEAGELCVKGPQVMLGYWQNQQATDEVLDAQGWLRTGDIAIIQTDGFIRLVDRKKDMIVVSGFNVFPNEIEEVLSALPQVAQCAAIGVPDERTGEAVKVFVVLRAGQKLDEQRIIEHMRKNLTKYKVAKHVEFRSELPTSNVGKVLRRQLREQELAGR